MYLERVGCPADLKSLRPDQLPDLCGEVRALLIQKLSETGGHVGSNLGVVELAVALHYVFESPKDKIVWDVSHQSYAHKILTGRRDAYADPSKYKEVNGFSDPRESVHDLFRIGHTSTSLPLALGLAKSRDTFGGTENIIAVTGDGALSGGEAFEGFDLAGEYGKNLIVVLNDNDQSVAENHGALYTKLRELRETDGLCPDNPFRALGFEYRYCGDGNDVNALVRLFSDVRGTDHPVLLHLRTVKGKGLPYAEQDRENWHSAGPFRISDGAPKNGPPRYDTTVHDSLAELLARDPHAVILTPGTPRALGFVGEERQKWEDAGRFLDVGIAEACAVTAAAGIARYGGTAVVGVYAPFLQRAYDQLSHDLCLNRAPATILVLLPGAYGMKSDTHLGLCDIPMLSHIPNLVYLSPATKDEYRRMLEYATTQKEHPTAIRVPVRFADGIPDDPQDYRVLNRARVLRRGSGTALIAVGSLIPVALATADAYRKETGTDLTVINPVFLTGTDDRLLDGLAGDHSLVITLEDGERDCGYGQKIASFYGASKMNVVNLGVSKAFHSDFSAEQLLAENGISAEQILDRIRTFNTEVSR